MTNVSPFDGRVYVIILDDKQTAALRTPLVKKAARSSSPTTWRANDIAAIVTTGGQVQRDAGVHQQQVAPAARGQQLHRPVKLQSETQARLDAYQNRGDRARGAEQQHADKIDDPLDMERGYDARMTLETLTRISDWVASIRGRRKAIVFFSEGIDYDIYDFNKREASTVVEKTKDVIASATRSDVAIYSIDPRGLTSLADESDRGVRRVSGRSDSGLTLQSFNDSLRQAQNSLRTLSEETGGYAAVNQNDFTNAFTASSRTTATTTCWATTRRTIAATAGSGASK